MKSKLFKIGSALSIAALATACGAGDMEGNGYQVEQGDTIEDEGVYVQAEDATDAEEVGTLGQAWRNCANPDGTNSVMAAFAVAVGEELRRWQAWTDFEVYNTSAAYEGAWGYQQAIRLTSGTGPDGKPRGKSRCNDGRCAQVQALLAMQYENARNQVWVQGENSTSRTLVDPGALRSRMVAKLREQKSCDDNARDGDPNRCPREAHLLSPAGTASLGGCGIHYKFNVSKDASGTLSHPNQLKWKLGFADQANGWVDFRNLGSGQVAIDPTYGLNEAASTSAGSCMVACTRISRSNISGQCCTCGGMNKRWAQSTFSTAVFACR